MVGADGRLPLPWLAEPLSDALTTQRGHAVLLHGPQGIGQFDMALAMAQAWLCEAAVETRPCGRCASCRLVQSHSHPDLLVLLPEALREPLGWNDAAGDDGSEKTGKAKPSKEIKVEAVRLAVSFAQSTAARGRGKVVVLNPAERLNAISANTLLKTLEEPPGDSRFILCSAAPDALLPTIRSRCQDLPLRLPPFARASAWLAERGVAQPDVMLRAAGGQPLEALEWAGQGIDAALWLRLPEMVARGEAAALTAWPLPRLIDALQKLCHDAACHAAGAAPRYFPATSLPAQPKRHALGEWNRELQRLARHAEHPWNVGLAIESLMQQGSRALAPAAVKPKAGSVHSTA